LQIYLLINSKIKIKSIKINKIISKISYLTFGAYLLSRIFDAWIYQYLINNTETVKDRLLYIIPIVLTIIIGALLLSYIIDIIQKIIKFIIKTITTKITKKSH